jgi:hypothetical protein
MHSNSIASSGAFTVAAVIIIIATFTTSVGGTTPKEVSDNGKNLLKSTGASSANAGGGQSETEDPVVTTPLGKVRGYPLQSREGRQYFGFYKVPFAQPPLGDLRFKVRCNTNWQDYLEILSVWAFTNLIGSTTSVTMGRDTWHKSSCSSMYPKVKVLAN